MTTVDNMQDVIDSRDVLARIEELESERDAFTDDARGADWSHGCPDDCAELEALLALANEVDCTADWVHGEALIRESHFTDYIQELIGDCYDEPSGMDSGEWPWRHLQMDWEGAADEAKVDYMEADFGGVTYLIRA